MSKVLKNICFILLIGFVSSFSYADCNPDIQRNDFEYCGFNLDKIRELADKGDKEAQFRLGLKYHKGDGLPKNYDEAAKWYKKASDQNQLDARHNLALLYKTGTKKDLKKAFELEKSAAELGHKYAQNTLGLYYLDGIGTKKDVAQGIKWLTTSASQGLPDAQDNLGKVYEFGKYVDADERKAFYWYEKAALLNYAPAQFSACIFYRKGIGINKDTTKALEYCRSSAQNGYLDAQVVTGVLLRGNIEGIKPNYEESFYWLNKAAKKGDKSVYYFLATAYEVGAGVKKDKAMAKKWYELAAKNGDRLAQKKLSNF